jgi:hypothetical protein
MNVSEPPPERKAANTLCASRESVVDKVVHLKGQYNPTNDENVVKMK